MPSPPLYTLALLRLNHPLRRYLESGHSIHTHPLIAISKSSLAIVFLRPQHFDTPCGRSASPGGFIASVRGSRYTIVGLPAALLHSWLADGVGVPIPQKEVSYA